MKHIDKCKLTSYGTYKCLRIKFCLFCTCVWSGVPQEIKLKGALWSAAFPACAPSPGIPVGQEWEWLQFIQVSLLITESSAWGLGRREKVYGERENTEPAFSKISHGKQALQRALRVLLTVVSIDRTGFETPWPTGPKMEPRNLANRS